MERRRAIRVPVAARAQVTSLGRWVQATLTDLSMRGAQLIGDDLPRPGASVRLQVSLDGHALRLDTTAAWSRTQDRRGGVSFAPLTRSQRQTIADALLRANHRAERDDGAIVLVINGSPCFAEMATAIQAHGFAVHVAASPLEALRSVSESDLPVRAAIVARALAPWTSEQLLDTLAAEHPSVRRILVLEDAAPAVSLDTQAADHVLLWPWNSTDLEAMFDLVGHPRSPSLAQRAPEHGARRSP